MRGRFIGIGFILLALSGCASQPSQTQYLLGGTLWARTSGEQRALHYQAFYAARLALEKDLATKKKKLPRAIVVDLDETILDNGPYQEKILLTGQPFPAHWPDWVKKADAKAIPGAAEFLQWASSKKVKIFYVTNRTQEFSKETTENLKKLGLPEVTEETLITKVEGKGKEDHRRKIREKYSIVLLVGDNLNDFSDIFEKKNPEERVKSVDELRAKFGVEFIMLANPMYGDWEGAIYNYNYGLPPAEKEASQRSYLKGF